jgi:hypothetical protein
MSEGDDKAEIKRTGVIVIKILPALDHLQPNMGNVFAGIDGQAIADRHVIRHKGLAQINILTLWIIKQARRLNYVRNIRTHIEIKPKSYATRIFGSTQQAELEIVDAEGVMPEIKDPNLISITCRIIKVPSIGRG